MDTLVIISIILMVLIIYYLVNRYTPNTEIDKNLDSKAKTQFKDDITLSEIKTSIEKKDNVKTQNKNWKTVNIIFVIVFVLVILYFITTTLEKETVLLIFSLYLILFSYIYLLSKKEIHIVKFNKFIIGLLNKILHKIGFGENVLNDDNNWEIMVFGLMLFGIPIYITIQHIIRIVSSLLIYILNIWYFIVLIIGLYFLYKLWSNTKLIISKIAFTIGIVLLFIYLYEYRNYFKFLLKYTANFDEYNN